MSILSVLGFCAVVVICAMSAKDVVHSLRVDDALRHDESFWPVSDRTFWRMSRGFPLAFFSVVCLLPPVGLDMLGAVEGQFLSGLVSLMLSIGITGLIASIAVGLTGRPTALVPKSLRPGGSQEGLIE